MIMKRTQFILLAAAWCFGSLFTQAMAQNWILLPGSATDIGVGADGTVWNIGNIAEPGGYGV